MTTLSLFKPSNLAKDIPAGLVVFLVALPLCLGISLASNAPLAAGIIAGIVGGLVVGVLSGSSTSVTGPAAGLTAVVASQIAELGSFQAFLVALIVAGALQIVFGLLKGGFLASFFPSSVVKGLLAAIGIIIILKQLPHLVGYDANPVGDTDFCQTDQKNTFTELPTAFKMFLPGATMIGLLSLGLLVVWGKVSWLQKSPIPGPLVAVLFGTAVNLVLIQMGHPWAIAPTHLVQVPVAEGASGFLQLFSFPDFSALAKPAVYGAAVTLAVIASLETLLTIEAVDKIDPQQRKSPANRELLAQGAGNMVSGFLGGLPITSVIVRSGANLNAGAQTKISAIFHGVLLLGCVALLPRWLNQIPLCVLAAVLIVTGYKLASPKVIGQMWSAGKYQFLPFAVTVVAIVLTNLLTGILIGLGISLLFILRSNYRRSIHQVMEKHVHGDVLRVELAPQVSFFNRAALQKILMDAPRGTKVQIDARNCDFIDPDILDLLTDFKEVTSRAHGVEVSLVGFKKKYEKLQEDLTFVDYSSREVQQSLKPAEVLQILKDGHERFLAGKPLVRDLRRQAGATATGQFPIAAVLGCIDSRAPVEHIFDLGVGDAFVARIAGNVARDKMIGSLEFACGVAGAKLLLVLGHTSCGAVKASVELKAAGKTASEATGCDHLDELVGIIQGSIDSSQLRDFSNWADDKKRGFVDAVARKNVVNTMNYIREKSGILDRLVRENKIMIVGAVYDVSTGKVEFL
ncbi:MAG: SulP family inorganic anion transporter [Candidatus Pacebacteria bacterium]|nr:SulP family inorganic anion transporter [Candidatus Paceibacterota bacterium]